MASKLPEDDNGHPIPALRFRDNGAHQVTVTAVSTRNIAAFSSGTDVVGVYATDDVFIKFGDNTATATSSDHFIPGGVYLDLAIGPNDTAQNAYIAALAVAADCTLYISEKA